MYKPKLKVFFEKFIDWFLFLLPIIGFFVIGAINCNEISNSVSRNLSKSFDYYKYLKQDKLNILASVNNFDCKNDKITLNLLIPINNLNNIVLNQNNQLTSAISITMNNDIICKNIILKKGSVPENILFEIPIVNVNPKINNMNLYPKDKYIVSFNISVLSYINTLKNIPLPLNIIFNKFSNNYNVSGICYPVKSTNKIIIEVNRNVIIINYVDVLRLFFSILSILITIQIFFETNVIMDIRINKKEVDYSKYISTLSYKAVLLFSIITLRINLPENPPWGIEFDKVFMTAVVSLLISIYMTIFNGASIKHSYQKGEIKDE